MWYVIVNRRTGRFVAGTDFTGGKGHYRQRLADEYLAPRLFTKHEVDFEFKHRGMNPKTYKIVPATIIASEALLDSDTLGTIIVKSDTESDSE